MRPILLVGCLVAVAAQGAVPGAPDPVGTFGAVQVLTTATPVPASPLGTRNAFQVQNLGAADIYCGWGAGVTVLTGTRVPASGGILAIDVTYKASGTLGTTAANTPKLYCIAAAAQTSPLDTRYMEVR